ncbi:hypothetical protein EW146_g9459 [Bondarzewia mesenterica]|uniref:Integrase catalytic domain-containing protein n=1 Tax=Bondarzewia mesenterica TaxID=1095465 RepID=A0A4S4L634_9AGAM|nr:hypothetical protein EW146_g9459 [Bondarzewia mesenterica]
MYGSLLTLERHEFGLLTAKNACIWDKMDSMVKNLILFRLTHLIHRHMEHLGLAFPTARSLWIAIHDEFLDKGIVAQVNSLHHALSYSFTSNGALIPIWDNIIADVDRIFKNGTLTHESLAVVIGLQALTSHFPEVHQTIQTVADFSITTFRHRLEALDESRAEHSSHYSSSRDPVITVASSSSRPSSGNLKPTGPRAECSHCRGHHPSADCWATFRKPPEAVLRDRHRRGTLKDPVPSLTDTRPPSNSKPANNKPSTLHSAPATLDSAFIESAAVAFTEEDLDYFSCAATIDSLPSPCLPSEHCSVDWSIYGPTSNDPHTLSASPTPLFSLHYFFDSGSSCHISPHQDDLSDYVPIPPTLFGVSTGRHFILKDVLFIPGAAISLISVGQLYNMDNKYCVQFDDECCLIRQKTGGHKLVATGTCTTNHLYRLNGDLDSLASSTSTDIAAIATPADLATWHHRLGHVNVQSIMHMARHGLATGMPTDFSNLPPACDHCILAKQMKAPVPKIQARCHATRPLGIVYADIIRPEAVEAKGGHRFSLNLIDDYGWMSFCYTLRQKSDSLSTFCDWCAMVERQFGHLLGIFCTDNSGEFTASEFERYLTADGILHQVSAPYTSAHMGEIERAH